MLSGTARGGFGCRGETVAEHAFQSVRWTGRATARFSDSDGWLAPEETTGGPSSCSGSRCGSTGGYEIDGLWPCVLSSWLASERAAAGRRIRHVCLGAAETLFEQLPDYTLPPPMLEAHERGALGARNVLGETAFRDAWMAGRTMAIDQAVSLGLGLPALANPPPTR